MYIQKIPNKQSFAYLSKCYPLQQTNQQSNKNLPQIGQLNWLKQQMNISKQNQQSLQQKIIQLYEAIQNKTIKNIQSKKNNQILKAQVETYNLIIQKIKKANSIKDKSDKKPQTTKENSQLEASQQNLEKNQDNQDSNTKSCQFSNQTFHQDENNCNIKQKKSSIFINKNENIVSEFQNYQLNRSSTQNCLRIDKIIWGNIEIDSNRVNKIERASCFDSNQENNEEVQIQLPKRAIRNKQIMQEKYKSYQNTPGYFSPRSSIGDQPKKLGSPNKSFLKKFTNNSTNNQNNKYSSVNIQQLWNDSNISQIQSKIVKNQSKIQAQKKITKESVKLLKNNRWQQNDKAKAAFKFKK